MRLHKKKRGLLLEQNGEKRAALRYANQRSYPRGRSEGREREEIRSFSEK